MDGIAQLTASCAGRRVLNLIAVDEDYARVVEKGALERHPNAPCTPCNVP